MEDSSPDIIHKISQFLSPRDFHSFATTNKHIRTILFKHSSQRLTQRQNELKNHILHCLQQNKHFRLKSDRFRTHRFFLLYLCRYFKSVLILTSQKQSWQHQLKLFNYSHIIIRKKYTKSDWNLVITDYNVKINTNSIIYERVISLEAIPAKPSLDPEINIKRAGSCELMTTFSQNDVYDYECVHFYSHTSITPKKHSLLNSAQTKRWTITNCDSYYILNKPRSKRTQPDLIIIESSDLNLITYIYVKYVLKGKNKRFLKIVFWTLDPKVKSYLNLMTRFNIFEPQILEFLLKYKIEPNGVMINYIYEKFFAGVSFNRIYHELMNNYSIKDFKLKWVNKDDLVKMSLIQLKHFCQNNTIRGYSKKNKFELVNFILEVY